MSAAFSRKYGVATHIYINIPKAGSANHAVGADWTPAAGDVKISKDGGAAANVTNLPTAIAMGNSAIWDFSFAAAELQAATINITVSDSATKAVDDTGFIIETYGNASAQHAFDLATATQKVDLETIKTQTVTCAAGVTVLASVGTAATSTAQTGDAFARLGAPAGASVSADIAGVQADTNDIQTRLPAALSGGKMDSVVSADDIATAVWNAATATYGSAGSYGLLVETNMDAAISSRLATAGYTAPLDAAGTRSAVGLASANLDTQLATIATYVDTEVAAILAAVDTEVAAIKAKTDNLPASPASSGEVAAILTTQFTESYRADGAAPTLAQGICELLAHHGEVAIAGTTKTIKKFDGTTSAATFTLDSGVTPTAITRAT